MHNEEYTFKWIEIESAGPAKNFADSVDPNRNLDWEGVFEEYGHLINATYSDQYIGKGNYCNILYFKTEQDRMLFILKYS